MMHLYLAQHVNVNVIDHDLELERRLAKTCDQRPPSAGASAEATPAGVACHINIS